eukprot:4972778-Prymnesium_polylepis.1
MARREEMHGIKAKKALRGLPALAREAIAKRGLAPAEDDEIAEVERAAAASFERERRSPRLQWVGSRSVGGRLRRARVAGSSQAARPCRPAISLLEPLLGEHIEMLALLDRALCLAEVPHVDVCVFRAFRASASDRNLAIIAQPAAE